MARTIRFDTRFPSTHSKNEQIVREQLRRNNNNFICQYGMSYRTAEEGLPPVDLDRDALMAVKRLVWEV